MIYVAWLLNGWQFRGLSGYVDVFLRAAFPHDYTANLPISNLPNALNKSVGFRMIATPRTPEPIDISVCTKTDSSARIRMGRGNPNGVTAPRTKPVAASTSVSLAMEIRATPRAVRRRFHATWPDPAISTMTKCPSANRKTILRTICPAACPRWRAASSKDSGGFWCSKIRYGSPSRSSMRAAGIWSVISRIYHMAADGTTGG